MITSAYSKSSNFSGFTSILEKFCMMICEMIAYKMVCGIFLILCHSSFINNFIVKLFRKKFCANKLEEFFFLKKFFFKDLELFSTTAKPLIWASFFRQKNIFILFFQVRLFNFNAKDPLRIYLEKLWKVGDFTLLNKPFEPYKLP